MFLLQDFKWISPNVIGVATDNKKLPKKNKKKKGLESVFVVVFQSSAWQIFEYIRVLKYFLTNIFICKNIR